MVKTKLSIIIPAYNAEPYIHELMAALKPQLTPEVEVIVVDDGSIVPLKISGSVKLLRQKNGGAACARNTGLDNATGDYIAFIDADDLVPANYVETILAKITAEAFDYCYLSWKTIGSGWQYAVHLKTIEDKFPDFNLCVWNRVYKRSVIGEIRFNERKKVAEDAEFIHAVKEDGLKKAFISDFMYFYRADTPGSLTKQFNDGLLDMERIVVHYPEITADMTHVEAQIRALNPSDKEIIIMTNKCEIPALYELAMVTKPIAIKGTRLIGEPTRLFTKLPTPKKAQIAIYIRQAFDMGGIETFIYNFCVNFAKKYKIMLIYSNLGAELLEKLKPIVECVRDNGQPFACDTLLNMRVTEDPPKNIHAGRVIQTVHTCKMGKYSISSDRDDVVFVSEAARHSFETDTGRVIHNMTIPQQNVRKALLLVTASRFTHEKGAERMLKLARALNEAHVPFTWLIFTGDHIKTEPGMVLMPPTQNIASYIKAADYLVQLSDVESFCYSIVEALTLNTPVLVTPLDVLPEIGFADGVNGYILPFDMNDIDIHDIVYNIPAFTYYYDNNKPRRQWRALLGDPKPFKPYKGPELVKVRCIQTYSDLALHCLKHPGDEYEVTQDRADQLAGLHFVKIL